MDWKDPAEPEFVHYIYPKWVRTLGFVISLTAFAGITILKL